MRRIKGKRNSRNSEGLAKRDIARANGQSHARELEGKGEASRIAQVGDAEAEVNRKKDCAYGDPRLFALNLLGEQLSRSAQPLVPERLFMLGSRSVGNATKPAAGHESNGLLPALLSLLVSEKSGIELASEKIAMEADQPGVDGKSVND